MKKQKFEKGDYFALKDGSSIGRVAECDGALVYAEYEWFRGSGNVYFDGFELTREIRPATDEEIRLLDSKIKIIKL